MDQNETPANSTPPKAAGTRPTAIDLFSKSFEAIKVNLPLHLLFYFAPMVVGGVLFVALLGSFVGTSALFGGGFESTKTVDGSSEALLGASFVVSLIGFAVAMVAISVVAYLANTYVGIQGAQGKKTDAGTAIRATTKYIGSLIIFGLLAAALVMAGFFLLVIPGVVITVYLWPRIMILPTVMIRENLTALDAYRRADKIVKAGGVWEVAFVFVAISFIGIIPFIGTLISAVLSFLYSLAPTLRVLEVSPKRAAGTPAAATPPAQS